MNFVHTLLRLLDFATGQAFNKSFSIGNVLGGVASSFLGNALGGGGGSSETRVQQTIANPFSVGGGLFTTNFGPGVSAGGTIGAPLTLPGSNILVGGGGNAVTPQLNFGGPAPSLPAPSIPVQAPVRRAPSRRGRVIRFGRPDEDGNVARGRPSPIGRVVRQGERGFLDAFNAASGGAAGGGGNNLGLNIGFDPAVQQLMQTGLFGADQALQAALMNENAALAGQLGGDFLSQLGTTDPLAIAQNQFDLVNPILSRGFEERRLDQEARQFAQGRLGSAGGARDVAALEQSQAEAERLLLADALGQGLASQAQLFNIGSGLTQLDPQLRGLFANLGGQFANIPLSFQQAALNQAQIGGALAGANTSGTLTSPGTSPLAGIGSGLLNSGVNQITNSIQNAFQPTQFTGVNPFQNPFTPDPNFGLL